VRDGKSANLSGCQISIWGPWEDLSDSCGFPYMGCPLWREDGSIIYNWYCASSPVKLVSDSLELMIFYCLKFETCRTWRTKYQCVVVCLCMCVEERGGQIKPPDIGFSRLKTQKLSWDRRSANQSLLVSGCHPVFTINLPSLLWKLS
jgi:hypothetical protein